jgi:cobalamin-dependent methionine synthase I
MSYTTESGRTQILDDSADAADGLSRAIAALGDVYDDLDEQTAERMEDQLFRPLQAAYGQLKRTRTEFAARHGLTERTLRQGTPGLPADPRQTLERVADEVEAADAALAELQDSLLPVEVGDQPLRAGLSQVRTLIGPVPAAADEFIRTLGR